MFPAYPGRPIDNPEVREVFRGRLEEYPRIYSVVAGNRLVLLESKFRGKSPTSMSHLRDHHAGRMGLTTGCLSSLPIHFGQRHNLNFRNGWKPDIEL